VCDLETSRVGAPYIYIYIYIYDISRLRVNTWRFFYCLIQHDSSTAQIACFRCDVQWKLRCSGKWQDQRDVSEHCGSAELNIFFVTVFESGGSTKNWITKLEMGASTTLYSLNGVLLWNFYKFNCLTCLFVMNVRGGRRQWLIVSAPWVISARARNDIRTILRWGKSPQPLREAPIHWR